MYRILFLSLLTLFLSTHTFSQCNPPTAAASLDINNVETLIQNGGDGWWDFNSARYYVPAASGKSPVFSCGLWIGGMDEADSLRLAGVRYRQIGNDYWSGPIPLSGNVDNSWCMDWNRLWKISQAEIDNFVNNGTPTSDIVSWPAKGNPNAPAAIDDDLAPFQDVNDDGVYNTGDGDYPLIKGDQMIFWVFNDVGNVHTETLGEPLGFEFHGMAYAFTGSTVVNNTTFYEYVIINKGEHSYSDLYLGEFVDIDLGFSQDDWVGVDESRNLVYGYNGFPDDQGQFGYGTDLPMIGIQMEYGPKGGDMHNFTHLENIAGGPYADPATAGEYYNFLTGMDRLGDPRVNVMGDTTLFRFNGVPGESGEAMCTEKIPGDYRTLQNYGPYTFDQGEIMGNGYSVIFVQDSSFQGGGCVDLGPFYSRTDSISDVFEDNRCVNFNPMPVDSIFHESLDTTGSIQLVSLGTEGAFDFEWSNGARTRNIAELSSGSYTVTISNHLGCEADFTFEVDPGPGVIDGINEHGTVLNYRLAPNPARTAVSLMPAPPKGTNVELYNIAGQRIYSEAYSGTISLERFQSGTYFMRVGNSVARNKLIMLD